MKFLSRLLVALVVTVMAHGFLAVEAQAAKPSGPKPSSPTPSSADLDLILHEFDDPSIFDYGASDYDLFVRNRGPSSGSGTLDIQLSEGRVHQTWGSSCTLITSRQTRCDLGSIAVNGSWARVALRVHVDLPPESTSMSVTVSGSVKGNQPDPDLSNNQKSESTTILPRRLPPPPYIDPYYCPPTEPLCDGLWWD